MPIYTSLNAEKPGETKKEVILSDYDYMVYDMLKQIVEQLKRIANK